MQLNKDTAKNVANGSFVASTVVIAAGIYTLLRGEAVDGAGIIAAGLSSAGISVYAWMRVEFKVQLRR